MAANLEDNGGDEHVPTEISKDDLAVLFNVRQHSLPIKKVSQNLENGLLETVLHIKGSMKGIPLKGQIDINERYTVVLSFYPHGFRPVIEYFGCLSLLIGIHSGTDEFTYAKFETSTLGLDDSKWFQESSKEYFAFPSDLFYKVKNIGSRRHILRRSEFFIQHRRVNYEVKITIDTRRQQPPDLLVNKPERVIQYIRHYIRSPKFGNASFIVGGVQLNVHKEILFDNDDVFFDYFESAPMKDGYYVLPDIYPQTFEKRIINCYFLASNFCKRCFSYPIMCGCDYTIENCTTGY